MAIQNDPRMYSAGAVQFDSSPSVNMYAQLMAKRDAQKRAKDEALNQYFDKELRDLSPTGVRDVHKPGIMADIGAAQQYWYDNKDKIMKGGAERVEFQRKIQNTSHTIQKAKDRDKFLLELGKAKYEGKYDPDEDDLNVLDKVGRSVYDKESYKDDGVSDYGWGDLPSQAAQFDVDKQNKFWATVDKGIDAGKKYDYTKQYKNPQTGQVIVPFTEINTAAQIKGKADRAKQLALSDPSAKKHYKQLSNLDNSELWEKYNTAFQSVYGKDKIVSNPEDFAAAEAIIRNSVAQKEGEEQELNYQQRQDDKRINISINKGSGGTDTGLLDYDVLGTYKNKVVDIDATKNGTKERFKGVVIKDVDAKDQELIGTKPYHDNGLTYYKVRPDGDWEGRDGQVISWAKVAQANLDKTSANEAKLGRTTLTADKTKPGTGNGRVETLAERMRKNKK